MIKPTKSVLTLLVGLSCSGLAAPLDVQNTEFLTINNKVVLFAAPEGFELTTRGFMAPAKTVMELMGIPLKKGTFLHKGKKALLPAGKVTSITPLFKKLGIQYFKTNNQIVVKDPAFLSIGKGFKYASGLPNVFATYWDYVFVAAGYPADPSVTPQNLTVSTTDKQIEVEARFRTSRPELENRGVSVLVVFTDGSMEAFGDGLNPVNGESEQEEKVCSHEANLIVCNHQFKERNTTIKYILAYPWVRN